VLEERHFHTADNGNTSCCLDEAKLRRVSRSRGDEYMWYASGDNDNNHPHFVYDGLSRRVRIEYGNVTLDQNDEFEDFDEVTTKEYAFVGTQPIVEYDYDSQQQTRDVARQYYWGLDIVAGIGGLLYQKVPNGTPAYYYYHYDGSGNVTAITDGDKAVAALYEYHAFGNLISKCGTLANAFTFSTQFAYGASGWSMYIFRNYAPRPGRWTQRDPIGQRRPRSRVQPQLGPQAGRPSGIIWPDRSSVTGAPDRAIAHSPTP
jgi:RHS repeat-associated protein